jgi:hypothetical protein
MSTLALKNAHPRDSQISFDEPTHVYTVNGSSKGIISVTKFLGSFHAKFDADKVIRNMKASPKWPDSPYFGKTDAAIKKQWQDNGNQASGAGTNLHLAIEQFLDGQEITDRDVQESKEWSMFLDFWRKHEPDLEPYRLEWPVFSEAHRLAGGIDAVFRRRSDGAFFIYDWKRCKKLETENRFESCLPPISHLPNTNYWHYTLQLNVYRYILEHQYGMVIKDMFLIVLHPNNETFLKKRLNRMDEEVEAMMATRSISHSVKST